MWDQLIIFLKRKHNALVKGHNVFSCRLSNTPELKIRLDVKEKGGGKRAKHIV